ncbi:MAG: CDP-glycerol glycerophosphotransferase family protein, partial [Actinomycetales bacterium]
YRETRTYATADEQPDLVYDTNSTNTLYRRDFLERTGLRYPEGRQYEDLLFITQAYALADGITLIPHLVYNWYVHEKAARLSVTNRRAEIRNLEDRLAIHREIDAFLAAPGREVLRAQKNVKFLKQDLRLYLNDLPQRDVAYIEQFLDLMGAYLPVVPEDAYTRADVMLGVAAHLIRRSDVPRLLAVSRYLVEQGKVDVDLVSEGGRVYWGPVNDADDRRWLDVTALGLQDRWLTTLPFTTTITKLSASGDSLRLEAVTRNHFGRLGQADVEIAVRVKQRGGGAGELVVEATEVQVDENVVVWATVIPMARAVVPRGPLDRVWDINVRLRRENLETFLPLSLPPDTALPAIPLSRRPMTVPADTVSPYRTSNGNLAFRLVATGAAAQRLDALAKSATAGETVRRLLAGLRSARHEVRTSLRSQDTKAWMFQHVLTRLPRRRGRVVFFESHMGRGYSDSPRYVYEELQRRLHAAGRDDVRLVWSYARDRSGFPREAVLVKRGSWGWWRALAEADTWVDNQGLPGDVVKPSYVRYLQTWHGSALKRMGEDSPGLLRQNDAARERHRRMVARWDYFLLRSEHDARTLARGLGVTGTLLRTGYPRNDPLVTLDEEQRRALRRHLRLPEDRTLILYAPTFRESYSAGRRQFELPVDLDAFEAALPDAMLLVRAHYLDRSDIPAAAHHIARDVSSVQDVTPLLAVADILVTDYSSVMFDFSVTGRPIVFFTYDYDDYVRGERGTYFDLAEEAPGPLVETSDELLQRLQSVSTWEDDFRDRYKRFVDTYSTYDTGTAAAQVVDELFPELPR